MRTYVIAGSTQQANDWINKDLEKRTISGMQTLSRSHYVVVTDPIHLRGVTDPHGVFIGTWKYRSDIAQIVEMLFMQSVCVNPRLEKIRSDIKTLKKPTPKQKQTNSRFLFFINGVMLSPSEYKYENAGYSNWLILGFALGKDDILQITTEDKTAFMFSGDGITNKFNWNYLY